MPNALELPSERVSADLRRRIQAGEWKPGEAIPSVTALVAAYGVSRATVHKAVRVLVAEGLLVSRARWATVVAVPGE